MAIVEYWFMKQMRSSELSSRFPDRLYRCLVKFLWLNISAPKTVTWDKKRVLAFKCQAQPFASFIAALNWQPRSDTGILTSKSTERVSNLLQLASQDLMRKLSFSIRGGLGKGKINRNRSLLHSAFYKTHNLYIDRNIDTRRDDI